MLTTYDLYKRPGYNFDVNDLVEFKLLGGYRLRTFFYGDCKKGIVKKSKNKNSNQTIMGKITSYAPDKLNDLEIELINENSGYEIKLKLSQCESLKIIS